MTRSKKILLAVAIAAIVILLIVAKFTGGANGYVNCPLCEDGTVECTTCKGEAVLDDGKACEDCKNGKVICGDCGGEKEVQGSAWALLPPIVAIGLALITKEVYSSLFVGILSGALLYSDFSITGTMDTIINDGLITAVSGSAGIFIFLVELGIIVALINKAGGSAAFGDWARKNIKTRVGAMLATFVLGVLIFVDDYFNCLTVGSVMLPVTDSKKVSRAKLAYLIDATAAPICMIAPISSWAAAVASYAPKGTSGIMMFIKAIPYNFYSLLTLVFIITICLMKFDYGPMKLHERNALEKGDLFTTGDRVDQTVEVHSKHGRVYDLIIPVIVLIVSCIGALIYNGYQVTGVDSLIGAFENTDATVALPWGGLISLVLIVAYLVARRTVSFKDSMGCIPQGFIAMVPAILILTFATALKETTSLLGAKYFVGDIISTTGAALSWFLPAVIFLVACGLSFATGTSWGTFGILIPIVLAIFTPGTPLATIGMSACLAGAVCGDHCSPISDTTIMSSAGARSNHLNHVSTQMPYALTVAGISFVMFILAGLIQNPWICLPIGVVLTIVTLFVIKLITNKKKA